MANRSRKNEELGTFHRRKADKGLYYYQKRTALITGASFGIGEAFARELAKRGMNLILVARSEERLRLLAKELEERYGINTSVIVADLSQPGAAKRIKAAVEERSLSVQMLINNAGFATYDYFERIDPEKDQQQIMVNIAAVVDMTHLFLPDMLKQRDGVVINVSSRGAFQPAAYMAVYAASKSFVLSFSEALWAEYRKRGIRVLAVCPGPVATNFFTVAGGERRGLEAKASPASIVISALGALERGKSFIIPGWRIFLLSQVMNRCLPRAFVARTVERLTRPKW